MNKIKYKKLDRIVLMIALQWMIISFAYLYLYKSLTHAIFYQLNLIMMLLFFLFRDPFIKEALEQRRKLLGEKIFYFLFGKNPIETAKKQLVFGLIAWFIISTIVIFFITK